MLLVLVVVASVIVIAAGLAARRAGGPAARRWADWLQWAGLAAAATAALTLSPAAAQDSQCLRPCCWRSCAAGGAVRGVRGITGRAWSGIAWLAAILAMAWAVLLTLGVGAAFLPAAFLQLAAAAIATASGSH